MSKLNKNIEIEINDLVFPNKGVGNYEDDFIYVKNTIPGQKVIVDVKKKKQKYEGFLKEIIKKADYETAPACKAFGSCGGCTYQNISYEKELEFKKNNVLKILEEGGFSDYEFLGISPCPSTKEYRNKMEFSFGDTGEERELSLGMRKRNSYYEVVNADECLIVHEDIRKIVSAVLNFFKNSSETFYHKMKHTGSLRHLLVRRAHFTGEILIALVTASSFSTDLTPLSDILKNINYEGKLKGFLHIINNSVADVVKADKINHIFGQDYITEKILGLTFKISIFSFFQTNSEGAEKLYSVVKDFAQESSQKENNVIFDLYCGTGTIAQILSEQAKKVIGIEIVEEAVEAAKVNAKLNNIENCEFIAGDVLKVVDELNLKPDLILLDPPREGINPKAIKKIIDFGAPKLIYISCKASSLSKDLEVFVENGYKIEKIKLVDMFGRTYHVETVVLLSR